MKKCLTCLLIKDQSSFHKHKGFVDGYNTKCKSCVKSYNALRYSLNKEIINKRNREWELNNKDKVKAITIKRSSSEKEKLRKKLHAERNVEKCRASRKAYKLRNLDRRRFDRALRRAAEHRAKPKWANKHEMLKIYKQAKLMSELMGEPYHVDHVIPLKHNLVCGLHCEFNLKAISANDNHKKNNKFIIE